MRLVLLSDPQLPDPWGNFWPAHRLARELSKRGSRVLHATLGESGRPAVERMEGVAVRRLPVRMPAEGPLDWLKFAALGRLALGWWLRELRERPPDLIHSHLSSPAVWLASRAASAMETPWVLTALGTASESALLRSRRARRIAPLLRSCAAAVAPSVQFLRLLERWLPSGCRIEVIPPAVDGAPGPLPPEPVVLGAGHQEPEMGFEVLLRAFTAVHRRRPDAVLLLAGQGPHRRRLSRLARALPAEVQASVRWEEAAGRQNLQSLYRRARVVVFPRFVEGGELAVAGAMAEGRAVVVTEAGGFPVHAVNGGNSLVVPPDDASALGEAILSLLENPSLLERIAQSAQAEAVRRCSWVDAAARYLDLFRALKNKSTVDSRQSTGR